MECRIATVVLLFAATALGQSGLPPGPGQEQVKKICSGCHSFGVITQNRATKGKWGEIVDNMVSRGAEGNDEELDQVVNYLAAHFGPDSPPPRINVNKAPAEELVKVLAITAQEAGAIV